MSGVLGTIKIKDFKIITKKEGITETWSVSQGDESKFIRFRGRIYKLSDRKEEKTGD